MSIAAALVTAQKAAHAVEKGSKNTFHRYAYASAEDVIEASRKALAAGDLALLPLGYEVSEDCGRLRARYALLHASGDKLELSSETPVVPEKGRPLDKAVATAKTYDLSYLLRGLLLLPRVEEGTEVDARDDRGHDPRRQVQPPRRDARAVAREGQPRRTQLSDLNGPSADPHAQTVDLPKPAEDSPQQRAHKVELFRDLKGYRAQLGEDGYAEIAGGLEWPQSLEEAEALRTVLRQAVHELHAQADALASREEDEEIDARAEAEMREEVRL